MSITAKENLILAFDHKVPEWIPDYRTEVCQYIPSCIHERAPGDGTPQQMLGGTGKDWFGVNWLFEPLSGGSMVDPNFPPVLTDITAWRDQVKFPDLDAIDWEAARKADEAKINPEKLLLITILNGPFERMHALMTMVEANCALITDPEESAALLMAIADYKVKLIDKIVQYYPVDVIELHDDWGHAKSTFMSIDTWRAIVEPAMKKIVQHVRSKGKYVCVHSCGKVETLIPYMIDIGIDHWSSCQACNNTYDIISKYGDKLTCIGGMDMKEYYDPELSDEQLDAMVKERMYRLCQGGAFIPTGSRSFPRVLKAVIETLNGMGNYFKEPKNRELPKPEEN